MRFSFLGLNPRLLLYLSAAGASCALYRHGRLEAVQTLATGDEGWEAFNGLLLKHPGLPVAIAVDTVDELYRQDRMPRAYWRDRREMTDRRLRQMMHHSPYRAALYQGRDKDTPHLDHYLLMGLANPELIRPWLDIVHLRGSHLAGIWLLPALTPPLVRHLGLDGNLLLVSEQTGGLRLTYLEQGALRFSRLAPVDGSQFENPLENYGSEIERTRQALVGQRLLARSEALRTVLLDPLDTLADLHDLLPEARGFRCETITRQRLLGVLDLPPSLLAESTDALYLRLLVSAPPSANLMTPEQRDETRVRWWGRGMRFVAGAWLGASLLFAAGLLANAWWLDQHAEALGATTRLHADREAQVLASVGGAEAVRHRLGAIHAWRALEARDHTPITPLQAAFAVASSQESIRISHVEWQAQHLPDGAQLRLEGEITPFRGDFNDAARLVSGLRDQLRNHLPRGTRVEVRHWPLDGAPERELEGEFGHSRPDARFSIDAAEPAR